MVGQAWAREDHCAVVFPLCGGDGNNVVQVGASGSAVVAGWLQGGMVLWFMFQAMVDLCCFLCATLVLLAGTACMEFL